MLVASIPYVAHIQTWLIGIGNIEQGWVLFQLMDEPSRGIRCACTCASSFRNELAWFIHVNIAVVHHKHSSGHFENPSNTLLDLLYREMHETANTNVCLPGVRHLPGYTFIC